MQEYRAAHHASELDMYDKQYCRELLQAFGENPQNGNDDDNLQVIPSTNNTAQITQLSRHGRTG
jgi:hypothetical protein